MFSITTAIEEPGRRWAIFHSHPKIRGRPSQTDINLADMVAGPLHRSLAR